MIATAMKVAQHIGFLYMLAGGTDAMWAGTPYQHVMILVR